MVAAAAAAWLQRQCDGGGNGGKATAVTQRRWRLQLGCGSLAAARWRRQLGGGSGSMAAAARWRWRKWRQRAAMVEATVTGWRQQLSSDARAFKCHQHAYVRAFVLGPGRRDNGADCVIVGNSGTRGNVHRGRRGADEAEGVADDTIC